MPHVEMSALAFVAFLSRGDVHFLIGKNALISMPRLRIITRCVGELNESRITCDRRQSVRTVLIPIDR